MVSVVIVNHNYGQYVGEAIESVLSQTYKDFEIIVVDGASTDNSREVIMSYVQRYPDVITAVFKPTSGQAAGFNVGFKMSKGDIIALLDADDYFLENKLERIVEFHKEFAFIGHGRKVMASDGNMIDAIALRDEYEIRPLLLRKYGYIYTYQLITSCISLTRGLAEKIFPMPEKGYVTFADCYVKVMAQYLDNIKYIGEALSYYRLHGAQESNSFADKKSHHQFCMDLYDRVFRDINESLIQKNEEIIPQLTLENLNKAFAMANPKMPICWDRKYILYGTGADAIRLYGLFSRLGSSFIYAIDSNPQKWGQRWNGIKILSPEQLMNVEADYDKIIIGSLYYYEEIKQKLESLGLKEETDFWCINSMPDN